MGPLEEEAVHPAMPQGTIGHGAQTSEEVRLTTDRPQTNHRRKTHMRLGDVILGTQGRSHPSNSDRSKIQSLYQGAMMLKPGIQGTQHQWPRPLNL